MVIDISGIRYSSATHFSRAPRSGDVEADVDFAAPYYRPKCSDTSGSFAFYAGFDAANKYRLGGAIISVVFTNYSFLDYL